MFFNRKGYHSLNSMIVSKLFLAGFKKNKHKLFSVHDYRFVTMNIRCWLSILNTEGQRMTALSGSIRKNEPY